MKANADEAELQTQVCEYKTKGKMSLDIITEYSHNSLKEDDDEHLALFEESKNSKLNDEKENRSGLLNSLIDSMGMSGYLIKILLFGVLTCFSDGSEMVVVSLIMRKLETKWKLTPMKKAFIGGSIFDGFLVGALVSGKLMDGKGRKFTLVFGSLIFLIFGIASSIATEFYSFMLFRIGVGLGLGFVIPTTQTFITELSPQNYRGFNSILIWLGFPLGEMYICYISHIFPLDDTTYHQENWQLIMILAALPVRRNKN
jgi:putative MFS transporter